MQELWLSGTALPVGAHLVVRHGFRSGEDHPIEVVYAFMLPRDATLKRFRVVGAGFDVHSELQSVADAQRAYEAGLEAGHLATLARTYRDGVVNLTVGNLKPGEDVQVLIELLAGVEARDDGLRFRFPFTLAPAYHAQARAVASDDATGELELPAALFDDVVLPEWKQDASSLHRVGFDLDVRLGGAPVEVSSPSHAIRCLNRAEGARVRLATEGDLPNRDLVIEARRETPSIISFAGKDLRDSGRFAVLVPSTVFGAPVEAARRVVFVLDRSGSMGGEPMRQARNAVRACLGALAETDTFGIVAFDSETERFSPSLVTGTSGHRDAAARFLETVDARGGTELVRGLEAALRLLGKEGGDLFLVTDGQVFGTEDIVARVKQCNARLHCLGIGSASQDRFLALLARQTSGVSRFATPRERVDLETLRLFSAVTEPVARRLRCTFEGMEDAAIAPQPADVVFQGGPLLLFGSCRADAPGALILAWDHAGEARTHRVSIEPSGNGMGETLRQLQGARLITDAESALAVISEEDSATLERLSREYELSSRAMALVAVVARAGDAAGETPETRVVPVGMPEGVQFESYFSDLGSSWVDLCECSREDVADFPIPQFVRSPRGRGLRLKQDMVVRQSDVMFSDVSVPVRRQDSPDRMIGLVAHAAMLEADGGLPGDTIAARVAASVALLLAFVANGSSEQQGPFAAHVRRLLEFLCQVDTKELGENETRILEAVLRQPEAAAAHAADWLQLASRVRENAAFAHAVWHALRSLAP